jgi:hypothetical protein
MILHCSHKLAAKLPDVSSTPLDEASPLGSWHGHLFTLDRRQCVMFMHDATRYALFLPGLRKAQFAELGDWFRSLYLTTLAAFNCSDMQIKKVELMIGPVRYDTTTDRSVQGSQRVAKQDLEAELYRVPNVMELDPVAVSCRLSHRPATVRGKWLWPDKAMLERIGVL